ncbi:MAG TPA: N(4)-(beta-N-acetylglucosaminyl)-L-asparaginase [Fimbriimonas sp.]|nr:N(4)-(beta-N-acetylglucosaminyl)-L-asparaginase [Fimbriimonas sp.]
MTTIIATWKEPGPVAIDAAWKARTAGASLVDTIEAGLAACEMDPSLLAIGLGSLPNSDGDVELDASIMDGRTLNAGAVCSVRGICPVITVARKVMEETPHVMLAGDQARRFAISKGIEPINLMTAANIDRYDKWKAGESEEFYVHSENESHDTVTMLGLETGEDGKPHLIAASATSGLAWKLPGRVGDSPIVGAGIYADDEIGAAGATGLGEELWKAVASYRAVRNMEAGMTAQEACEEVINHMKRRLADAATLPCVVFALRKDGDFGAATTKGEFPFWVCQDGNVEFHERIAE